MRTGSEVYLGRWLWEEKEPAQPRGRPGSGGGRWGPQGGAERLSSTPLLAGGTACPVGSTAGAAQVPEACLPPGTSEGWGLSPAPVAVASVSVVIGMLKTQSLRPHDLSTGGRVGSEPCPPFTRPLHPLTSARVPGHRGAQAASPPCREGAPSTHSYPQSSQRVRTVPVRSPRRDKRGPWVRPHAPCRPAGASPQWGVGWPVNFSGPLGDHSAFQSMDRARRFVLAPEQALLSSRA